MYFDLIVASFKQLCSFNIHYNGATINEAHIFGKRPIFSQLWQDVKLLPCSIPLKSNLALTWNFIGNLMIEFHSVLVMTFLLYRLQRLAKDLVKPSFWWYGGDSRLLEHRSAVGILVTANILSESEYIKFYKQKLK